MDYLSMNILDIHKAIISGEVTPLQLVKEAIKKAKEDDNNAFEYICEKEALERVKKLDESKKNNIFYGIPFVLKDNFSTKDILTTASCDILNGYIPSFSSEVQFRLEEAGAILIGKTTLDQLSMGGTGTTGHKGPTYNPWNRNHTHSVGGSSAGSAASIAAGIIPLAIGSDTGDSIRKPASYAALVGLKPSYGRISRWGLFPFATSLDHVGFFTRNVMDSALTLSLLAGRDEKDISSSSKPVDEYVAHINEPIRGKRVAVISNIISNVQNKTVTESFNKLVDKLKANDVAIDYIKMDEKLLRAIYPTYIVISSVEAGSNNANLDGIKFGERMPGKTYEEIVVNTRSACFSLPIKKRFVLGSYSLLKENLEEVFLRAQKCRRLIVKAFNDILEKYDAIICPASPTPAPNIKGKGLDPLSDEYLIADNYMAFANMGGMPSITIPLGFDSGLPFGLNITSKVFEEAKLLNIASEIEKITGLSNLVAPKE